jgi:V8-like Glu-specific endopeptidase
MPARDPAQPQRARRLRRIPHDAGSPPARGRGVDGRSVSSPPASARRPPEPLAYIAPGAPPAAGLRGDGEPEFLERIRRAYGPDAARPLQPASSASYPARAAAAGGQRRNRATQGDLSPNALTRIFNTGNDPWRHICDLIITTSDGRKLGGTGWLIGPRTVITAGHCVFQRDVNNWAYSIQVIPARDIDSAPYSSQVVNDGMNSVEGWTKNFQEESDYGALILPQPFAAGSFGCQPFAAADLSKLLVSVAGYPTTPPAGAAYGSLWGEAHFLQPVGDDDRQLFYEVDVLEGMSGGPVFATVNAERFVVGIQNYESADDRFALATRITPSVFDQLNAWRQMGS